MLKKFSLLTPFCAVALMNITVGFASGGPSRPSAHEETQPEQSSRLTASSTGSTSAQASVSLAELSRSFAQLCESYFPAPTPPAEERASHSSAGNVQAGGFGSRREASHSEFSVDSLEEWGRTEEERLAQLAAKASSHDLPGTGRWEFICHHWSHTTGHNLSANRRVLRPILLAIAQNKDPADFFYDEQAIDLLWTDTDSIAQKSETRQALIPVLLKMAQDPSSSRDIRKRAIFKLWGSNGESGRDDIWDGKEEARAAIRPLLIDIAHTPGDPDRLRVIFNELWNSDDTFQADNRAAVRDVMLLVARGQRTSDRNQVIKFLWHSNDALQAANRADLHATLERIALDPEDGFQQQAAAFLEQEMGGGLD